MNPSESFVAHLIALGFPIVTALLLLLFPLLALRFARSLLANLLDLTGPQAMAVTIAACVTAWTSMVTAWVILSYGPVRFGLTPLSFFHIREVPPWQTFALCPVLTLPLLFCAGVYSIQELTTNAFRFVAG